MSTHTTRRRLFVISCHDQAGFKCLGNVLVEHLDTVGPAASGAGYLANFSHPLAAAQSGLPWKVSCLAGSAAELREQLLTTLEENATRTSSSQKLCIGFVITGQGAQWARMGVEMLDWSVFSDSVSRSVAILRNMGCD
jgi:zearalenone synthase (highly reducing iterative type I polyketide synthase)